MGSVLEFRLRPHNHFADVGKMITDCIADYARLWLEIGAIWQRAGLEVTEMVLDRLPDERS